MPGEEGGGVEVLGGPRGLPAEHQGLPHVVDVQLLVLQYRQDSYQPQSVC